ncbi:MAG TPA: potassium channel protein [Pyrinomonadaceae bacterium]
MSVVVSLSRRVRARLLNALGALAAVVLLGTVSFHLIEGWTLLDSLYFTITTLATVGYGDLHPTSAGGRVFATFFIIVGVGTVGFVVSRAIVEIVQSEIVAGFGQRRRLREVSRLRNHFIICGAGRVGSRVIRELQRKGEPFVVVERDPDRVGDWVEARVPLLVRDATNEETLHEAGVEHARALAACLPSDADNVYVALTARGLNPNLHIVARANEEQAEPKLIRAGANRVIAPQIIGSQRMYQALTKPAVEDFITSITAEKLDLNFEEVEVAPASPYVGRRLRFTNIRAELDVVIVAVRRRGGEMIFNPSGDAFIEAGDMLIAIGRTDALVQLKAQAEGHK